MNKFIKVFISAVALSPLPLVAAYGVVDYKLGATQIECSSNDAEIARFRANRYDEEICYNRTYGAISGKLRMEKYAFTQKKR